ncbi:MAG: hypothetical protein WB626_08405 [Bacteroidota bacterium]
MHAIPLEQAAPSAPAVRAARLTLEAFDAFNAGFRDITRRGRTPSEEAERRDADTLMRRNLTRFLLPVLLLGALEGACAQFIREDITISVGDTSCTLEGLYEFSNPSPHSSLWPVFYPLLSTPTVPFPDSIGVEDAETAEPLPFLKGDSGISFSLPMPPRAERRVRIGYRQPAPARSMEYILTSTQRWKRPLEQAVFTIWMPRTMELTFLSVSHDSIIRREDRTGYVFARTGFMPRSNLVLRWERRLP